MVKYLGRELDTIAKIKNQIFAIISIEITWAENSPYVDDYRFEEVWELRSRILNSLSELREANLDSLPVQYLNEILGHLPFIQNNFERFKTFVDSSDSQWDKDLEDIQSEIVQWYNNTYIFIIDAITRSSRKEAVLASVRRLTELLGVLEAKYIEVDSQRQQANLFFTSEQDLLSHWKDERNQKVADYENQHDILIADIKSKLGDIGSSHHAVKFREEANRQYKEAFLWLAVAALVSGFIVWYSFGLEHTILLEKELTRLWPLLALKGVVVSVASVLLFVCVRSFSACRHNMIVNRHRENALSTFKLFSEAAQDSDTRNAVLMEATKAVFSQAPSGYLKAANETSPTTHIVEMIRSRQGGGSDEHH